jgi:hypothetical protein
MRERKTEDHDNGGNKTLTYLRNHPNSSFLALCPILDYDCLLCFLEEKKEPVGQLVTPKAQKIQYIPETYDKSNIHSSLTSLPFILPPVHPFSLLSSTILSSSILHTSFYNVLLPLL